MVGVTHWEPDSLLRRRLRVAPEGAHRLTVFAAFLSDLMDSVLGGAILSEDALKQAVAGLMDHYNENPPWGGILGPRPSPFGDASL